MRARISPPRLFIVFSSAVFISGTMMFSVFAADIPEQLPPSCENILEPCPAKQALDKALFAQNNVTLANTEFTAAVLEDEVIIRRLGITRAELQLMRDGLKTMPKELAAAEARVVRARTALNAASIEFGNAFNGIRPLSGGAGPACAAVVDKSTKLINDIPVLLTQAEAQLAELNRLNGLVTSSALNNYTPSALPKYSGLSDGYLTVDYEALLQVEREGLPITTTDRQRLDAFKKIQNLLNTAQSKETAIRNAMAADQAVVKAATRRCVCEEALSKVGAATAVGESTEAARARLRQLVADATLKEKAASTATKGISEARLATEAEILATRQTGRTFLGLRVVGPGGIGASVLRGIIGLPVQIAFIVNDIIRWSLNKELEIGQLTDAKSEITNDTAIIQNATRRIKILYADYLKALINEIKQPICGIANPVTALAAKDLELQMQRWRGVIETTQGHYQLMRVEAAGLEAKAAGKNPLIAKWDLWKYFGNDEAAAEVAVAYELYLRDFYGSSWSSSKEALDWRTHTQAAVPSWEKPATQPGRFPGDMQDVKATLGEEIWTLVFLGDKTYVRNAVAKALLDDIFCLKEEKQEIKSEADPCSESGASPTPTAGNACFGGNDYSCQPTGDGSFQLSFKDPYYPQAGHPYEWLPAITNSCGDRDGCSYTCEGGQLVAEGSGNCGCSSVTPSTCNQPRAAYTGGTAPSGGTTGKDGAVTAPAGKTGFFGTIGSAIKNAGVAVADAIKIAGTAVTNVAKNVGSAIGIGGPAEEEQAETLEEIPSSDTIEEVEEPQFEEETPEELRAPEEAMASEPFALNITIPDISALREAASETGEVRYAPRQYDIPDRGTLTARVRQNGAKVCLLLDLSEFDMFAELDDAASTANGSRTAIIPDDDPNTLCINMNGIPTTMRTLRLGVRFDF